MKQTWRGLHESLGSLRGAKLDAACACGGSQQIQGCTSCLAQCLLHREQDYTLICQPRDEPALGRIHQQRGATLHQHPAHVLTRDSGCTEQHTSRRGDATPTCPRCARSQILHHCLHVAGTRQRQAAGGGGNTAGIAAQDGRLSRQADAPDRGIGAVARALAPEACISRAPRASPDGVAHHRWDRRFAGGTPIETRVCF